MKKQAVLLLLAAWLMLCPAAQAWTAENVSDGAIVNGGASDRVHLRSGPSGSSASLGLYFTGTQAVRMSQAQVNGYVQVRIGGETGYMAAQYLETAPGAWVQARQPIGRISSRGSVNMRLDPSTRYQPIGSLPSGAFLIILGETSAHWYYVQTGDLRGYVRSDLAALTGETYQETVRLSASDDTGFPFVFSGQQKVISERGIQSWQQFYQGTLAGENGMEIVRYCFQDLDQDGRLELIQEAKNGLGMLVLHPVNEEIYAYEVPYRGMMELKQDGTFSYSSGAADSGFGRVRFDGTTYETVPESWSQSDIDGHISYFVQGRAATRADFDQAIARQDGKADAWWRAGAPYAE